MLHLVPVIDVVDSTWIAAPPASVGVLIAEPGNWPRWWPALDLTATELRGHQGIRWSASLPAERLTGSAEVWLEATCNGTVAHFFLRLDPDGATAARAPSVRRVTELTREYRVRTKRAFWAIGDRLDPGRLARLTLVTPVELAGR